MWRIKLYKLIEFIYIYQNEQALVLKALYECNVNVVLKFGQLESIEKEYKISQELFELPNFIRYFCLIKCVIKEKIILVF